MKKTVNYRSNSNTLATSCEELTHWKRPWCWEGLGAGREGNNRGWDGWMASLTRWTWVWVNSGSWWWTGRPGVLRFMGSQRVGHDWATDLIWSDGWFYTCIYYMFNTICMVSLWLEEKWSSIYRLWPHSHQTKGNLSHKIGSSSIHLIRTDSNTFFWWLSNILLCICTTAFLSIRLLMDI